MENAPSNNEASSGTSALNAGLGAQVVASDATRYGHDGKPWPQTMDANAWATEFCRRNSASDHGTMLGWFSSAIMIGHDAARREAEAKAKAPNA